MADDYVTETLCQERIAHQNTILDQIKRNGEETRRGVGNLNRRLFESGNGNPPIDVQLSRVSMLVERHNGWIEEREQEEKEESTQRRWYAARRNLGWIMFGASALLTGLLLWIQMAWK